MIVKRVIRILVCLVSFVIMNESSAQSQDSKLANEYFNKRDYEKSYEYYKKLIKNERERRFIYDNYISCVRKLDLEKSGIKVLNKLIDDNAYALDYKIDKAVLTKDLGNQSDYDKQIESLIDKNHKDHLMVLKLSKLFSLRKLNQESIRLLKTARKSDKSDFAYADQLAVIYKNIGKKDLMVDELLNTLETNTGDIESVENELQVNLSSEKEYDELIDKIYLRLDSKNANLDFNELLVWIYMQRKDFYNAFVQLRSIDKKSPHHRGSELIELGDVAYKNQDYKNAIKIYSHVTETYPTEYHYDITQKKLIKAKEAKYINQYPIDTAGIKSVLLDYDKLLAISRNSRVNAQIKISQSKLYALYLQNTSKAKQLLTTVIENPRMSDKLQAEAKILLGDIFLIDGETGEAMIQYMQVERMIEDDDLGHLAKLKTAKVSYFEAEFELAQAHLDILKRATTRKIANDAQDLSLLIKGNLDLDTTAEAMAAFANTELLTYQKKFLDALEALKMITIKFPNHALTDEIHYQRAQIFKQMNKFEEAVEELKLVLNEVDGVLADDALIEIARIYDFKIRDYTQSKEFYKRVLLEFPGSIYVAEARKKYYAK